MKTTTGKSKHESLKGQLLHLLEKQGSPSAIIEKFKKLTKANPSEKARFLDQMNELIEAGYQRVKMTSKANDDIKETFADLQGVLKKSSSFSKQYSEYQLRKYGSTINGLSTATNSDLDVTILLPRLNIEQYYLLDNIKKVLVRYGQSRYYIDPSTPRQDKSGWILVIVDKKTQVSIDILVNKVAEISNSQLILMYAWMDSRFLKVVHYLKAWNKSLSSEKQNRLNSFSLYLMLIAYMQREKMLPNLQALASHPHYCKLKRAPLFIKMIGKACVHSQNVVDLTNTHFSSREELINQFMALEYLSSIPKVENPETEDPFDCVLDWAYLGKSQGAYDHDELKRSLKSPAEILIGFLDSSILKDEEAAFDISQKMAQTKEVLTKETYVQEFYKGESVVRRGDLLDHLGKTMYGSYEASKFVEVLTSQNWKLEGGEEFADANRANYDRCRGFFRDNVLKLSESWYYFTLDPFNHSYNPAKAVDRKSFIYPRVFEEEQAKMIKAFMQASTEEDP